MLRFARTELKKTSRQIYCCNFLTHPWATEAHEQAIELASATEPEEPLAPQPPNYPPPQATACRVSTRVARSLILSSWT